MPISSFGGYDVQHWREVRAVIERGIHGAGLVPSPVWESSQTDVIQSRIVKNLYDNPIIICDVSGLNPNVMFELGLRIAFRKPLVIICDDETKLPFDTNVIEHIIYNRGLRFSNTEDFISRISERINSTLESSKSGDYTPYLDLFGTFTVIEPNPNKIEFEEYILNRLDTISSSVSELKWNMDSIASSGSEDDERIFTIAELKRHVLGPWSLNSLVRLVQMWDQGYTASQIADELGNVSRNAVIGKAHRLGLKSRPSPISNKESDGD